MIPPPTDVLARQLMRGPGLSLFVHRKAYHCARVATVPGRVAISIWDVSVYADNITDHESKEVPDECTKNFPIGWKEVARCVSESDTNGNWDDWILLPFQSTPEAQEDAIVDFMSTVNTDIT